MRTATEDSLSQALSAMHIRLGKHFHPPFIHANDRLGPISQLMYEFVARGTRDDVADAAFRKLTAAHWSWAEVRDAGRRRVELLLSGTTNASKRSEFILEALETISNWSGWKSPSLGLLDDLPTDESLGWLERLRGVTPSMSASVLLFSVMRRPVLPMDTAARRVMARLGLTPTLAGENEVHALVNSHLPNAWRASEIERHYFLVKGLSRRFCTARYPRCRHCPVRDLCAYGSAAGRLAETHREIDAGS